MIHPCSGWSFTFTKRSPPPFSCCPEPSTYPRIFPPVMRSKLHSPVYQNQSSVTHYYWCHVLRSYVVLCPPPQVEEAELLVADSSGETVDNKTRLEVLRQQEELIREEAEEKHREVMLHMFAVTRFPVTFELPHAPERRAGCCSSG